MWNQMLHIHKKIFILKLDIMVQEIFSRYSIYCKGEKCVKLSMPYWWIRTKTLYGMEYTGMIFEAFFSSFPSWCPLSNIFTFRYLHIRLNIIKGTEIVLKIYFKTILVRLGSWKRLKIILALHWFQALFTTNWRVLFF